MNAAVENSNSISFKSGISSHIIYEDFSVYELCYGVGLPDLIRETDRSFLACDLQFTAGMLSAADRQAFLFAIGPDISWKRKNVPIVIRLGTAIAHVSRHEFGNAHIGGPMQFFSHVGVELMIFNELGIGYALQHLSSANIYFHNPGMNLHTLTLSLQF